MGRRAGRIRLQFSGERSEDAPGYLYGYALEAICAHVGEGLPNICPISRATAWIEEVDAALEKKAVPIRLSALVFGGSPVPIPQPDDCPCIGGWPPGDIAVALAALRSLDVKEMDREMAETFAQIRGWLEEAAKTPAASVIGFLS